MTWTQLHEACSDSSQKNNNGDLIIMLIRQCVEECCEVDDHGSTPLHIYCSCGKPNLHAIADLLATYPPAASMQDIHGNTPLHIAASCEESEKGLVQLLVEACPESISMKNREGLMPLHMACRYAPKNEGVIGLLVEKYPYALLTHIKIGDLVSHHQSRHHPPELIAESHQHMVFDQSMGMTHKKFMDYKFEATGTQIRDGAYPLHMAVEAGATVSIVEMMIREYSEALLKVNKFGETSLHVAVQHQACDDVIETLIFAEPMAVRVHESRHHNTPIHIAAMVGCTVRVAKGLLEKWPESIHDKNNHGYTPLDLAINYENCTPEILRLFDIADQV